MPSTIITADSLAIGLAEVRENILPVLDQGGCEVSVKAISRRSADQNRKMWAALSDIANQVIWHGQKLTSEEWKCVISASLHRQKVVPGIDGNFVVVGLRTSKMSRREFADLITMIDAFGAQQAVEWTDPEFQSLVKAENEWMARNKKPSIAEGSSS